MVIALGVTIVTALGLPCFLGVTMVIGRVIMVNWKGLPFLMGRSYHGYRPRVIMVNGQELPWLQQDVTYQVQVTQVQLCTLVDTVTDTTIQLLQVSVHRSCLHSPTSLSGQYSICITIYTILY